MTLYSQQFLHCFCFSPNISSKNNIRPKKSVPIQNISDYKWHIFDWKTTDCDIRCDKVTAKMCIKESDSIEDNTINNNDKNFKTSEFKLCPSKTNGLHCISKTICKDRNEFCALTLLDLSQSQLNSIPIEINNLKK